MVVERSNDTYALVGDGSRPTGGIGQAGPDSPYLGIVVYFPVDDIDAALARAESLGGTRVMEPTETPTGVIAAIADPDGNTVGLQADDGRLGVTGTASFVRSHTLAVASRRCESRG